ncbi:MULTISPECIES: hypothetical protein [Streptomyces]|uniref:Transposase IS204/IS1001/IS1096/IS1165 DDE domain-containing protein n=2 Tax=Streptomyces TaxID=1883 RepID=A0ABV9J7G9_9ACTN
MPRRGAGNTTLSGWIGCSTTAPEPAQAHQLVRGFVSVLVGRDAVRLGTWLQDVEESERTALRAIVKVFRGDRTATDAGITTAHNSGVIDGWITDVKLIKRQVGGRAGIVLLRQHISRVPHSRRASPKPCPDPRC